MSQFSSQAKLVVTVLLLILNIPIIVTGINFLLGSGTYYIGILNIFMVIVIDFLVFELISSMRSTGYSRYTQYADY